VEWNGLERTGVDKIGVLVGFGGEFGGGWWGVGRGLGIGVFRSGGLSWVGRGLVGRGWSELYAHARFLKCL
jgi:hypothetical protein